MQTRSNTFLDILFHATFSKESPPQSPVVAPTGLWLCRLTTCRGLLSAGIVISADILGQWGRLVSRHLMIEAFYTNVFSLLLLLWFPLLLLALNFFDFSIVNNHNIFGELSQFTKTTYRRWSPIRNTPETVELWKCHKTMVDVDINLRVIKFLWKGPSQTKYFCIWTILFNENQKESDAFIWDTEKTMSK